MGWPRVPATDDQPHKRHEDEEGRNQAEHYHRDVSCVPERLLDTRSDGSRVGPAGRNTHQWKERVTTCRDRICPGRPRVRALLRQRERVREIASAPAGISFGTHPKQLTAIGDQMPREEDWGKDEQRLQKKTAGPERQDAPCRPRCESHVRVE